MASKSACLRALSLAILAGTMVEAASVAPPPAEGNWNFEQVGQAVLADGTPDAQSYSKLAPWPGQHAYDVIIGPGDRLYASDATAGLRVLRHVGPGAGARRR